MVDWMMIDCIHSLVPNGVRKPTLPITKSENPDHGQIEFHLQEYTALRKEADDTVAGIWALERYALLVTGTVYSWFASSSVPIPPWAWAIPFAVNCLGGLRAWGLFNRLLTIDEYLKKLETMLAAPGMGWEHVMGTRRGTVITDTAWMFWSVLDTATMIIAVWYGVAHPLPLPGIK
jgi:hypothetical protein